MTVSIIATESTSDRFRDLDQWDSTAALDALWEGQMAAVASLRPALPEMAKAVEAAALRLAPGHGRLVYVGAGTSGRLAALDAAELPPTFDWPADRNLILIAGGTASLLRAVEGAEDDAAGAAQAVRDAEIGPDDVVIALAASGTTPWAVSAVKVAREQGALTLGLANSADTPLLAAAEHAILLETGAEAIAGSTRMKAGTAQKAALTLFSTLLMIRLGRIYRGRMVEMRPTNAKLMARAIRMVMELADCQAEQAEAALAAANGRIPCAVLMLRAGLDAASAEARLLRHGGLLRAALEEDATSL
jgi:N-acetylmuramic acid 6-phosphate etherase